MNNTKNGRTTPQRHPPFCCAPTAHHPHLPIDNSEDETILIEETWTVQSDGSILIEEEARIAEEPLTLDDFLDVLHANELQPTTRRSMMRVFPTALLRQAFDLMESTGLRPPRRQPVDSLEADDDMKADIAAEMARRGGAR